MDSSTETTSIDQSGGLLLIKQKVWRSNERFKTIFWGHLCDGVVKYRNRYDGDLYHTQIDYKNIKMLVTLTGSDLYPPHHFPDGNDFSRIDWKVGDSCFVDEEAGSGFGWIQTINDHVASVRCLDPELVQIDVPVKNLVPRYVRDGSLQTNEILSKSLREDEDMELDESGMIQRQDSDSETTSSV